MYIISPAPLRAACLPLYNTVIMIEFNLGGIVIGIKPTFLQTNDAKIKITGFEIYYEGM